jgi:hypothetical protein
MFTVSSFEQATVTTNRYCATSRLQSRECAMRAMGVPACDNEYVSNLSLG